MAGLLDIFTGGKNNDAQDALKKAQRDIDAIQVPTIQGLTLPELQQYVSAGVMTPAQMEAYLQQNNALADQNIDQAGTQAQVAALNQLSGVANAGAQGTAVSQAQQADAIDRMNQATGGQRGAIEQSMAAKGTPAAMIQAALSNQYQGQDAQQAHRDSLQSQAQSYQQAVNAMAQGGQLGGQLQGQQNTQGNTVAQAQNAMQQFNAQNQQNASLNNANMKQEANTYNTENAQNVSSKNTGLSNERTRYNANVPETVFQNQMQKAGGQANVAGQQANQATQAGQQEAGLWGGIIGAGATLAGGPIAGMAANQVVGGSMGKKNQDQNQYQPYAHGGVVGHEGCYHDGGVCMDDGGMVPGEPEVSGDSLQNDTVTAHVSPGEAVIPRTTVQERGPEVMALLNDQGSQPDAEVHDVATILKALRELRMGTV